MSGTDPRYRLAAIDIDDTLLGRDGKISRANAAAIEALRERGVRVVLASGRSHANMLRYHEELALGEGPVVSVHGAVVRDARGDATWFEHAVPAAAVAEVTRDGLGRGLSVQQYRRDGIYLQGRTRWTDYDESRADTPHVLVPELLAAGSEGVFKVMWLGQPAAVSELAPKVAERYAGVLCVTETDPGYLEFTHASVNKGAALAAVAERLGVLPEQVLAFGDGNNDVAMLAWAGMGVAMSHARPSAKAAAKRVAPEGDPESSLARAIQLVLAS